MAEFFTVRPKITRATHWRHPILYIGDKRYRPKQKSDAQNRTSSENHYNRNSRKTSPTTNGDGAFEKAVFVKKRRNSPWTERANLENSAIALYAIEALFVLELDDFVVVHR
jgi:hypothetical protein